MKKSDERRVFDFFSRESLCTQKMSFNDACISRMFRHKKVKRRLQFYLLSSISMDFLKNPTPISNLFRPSTVSLQRYTNGYYMLKIHYSVLELNFFCNTIKAILYYYGIVQYLISVQHSLLSCDNYFFLVISQSMQHSLWLYVQI